MAVANAMIVPPATPVRAPNVHHFSAHTPGAHLGELALHWSHSIKPVNAASALVVQSHATNPRNPRPE